MFIKSKYPYYTSLISKKPSIIQNSYIFEAETLALKSTVHKKHGCVIVQHNKIIARGYNKHISHNNIVCKLFVDKPFTGLCTIHAEVDALNDLKKKNIKISDAHMYVVRVSNDKSSFMCSSPCENCAKYINKFSGINKVYFTTDNDA